MNLFDHEDRKERKRVGKKMAALASEQRARLEETLAEDRKASAQAVEFTKEASRRMILADYASLNEEPVITAGFLVSPYLVAYGWRHSEGMRRHAVEADARAKKEAGNASR